MKVLGFDKMTFGQLVGYPIKQIYVTEKYIKLLDRIIRASKKGNIVLDPFCGFATACISAEYLNRKWIGIDILVKAHELVNDQIREILFHSNMIFK